jgi:L,D-peptidoglycan transpeptidase YkuD (ErfK/YbiS/YcfS/YnhG family)
MKYKGLWWVWLAGMLLVLSACSCKSLKQLDKLGLPAVTSQVLLVTTADWNASTGTLQRMERSDSGWQKLGEPIPVQVGRNGLGWGVGLHKDGKGGVQKMEGDGKAPAGVFALGNVFGYAPQAPAGVGMLYRMAGERDYFVDATDSPDYNHWRHIPDDQPNEPKQYWSSFERMRRDDQRYEYGLVVGHNMMPTVVGRGSAIFLHVWLNPETSTSGCTAMSRENLLEVLKWLKPAAQPLLVQVPQDELADLRL